MLSKKDKYTSKSLCTVLPYIQTNFRRTMVTVGKKIGSGVFGTVQAKMPHYKQVLAVKEISSERCKEDTTISEAKFMPAL